ncbi:hypothetical protein D1007_57449 [Hordeum vulgare]|nr:hypothetical protein D1007_57449 [Hordeum vulgare]
MPVIPIKANINLKMVLHQMMSLILLTPLRMLGIKSKLKIKTKFKIKSKRKNKIKLKIKGKLKKAVRATPMGRPISFSAVRLEPTPSPSRHLLDDQAAETLAHHGWGLPNQGQGPALPLRHLTTVIFPQASPARQRPGAPSTVALGAHCGTPLPRRHVAARLASGYGEDSGADRVAVNTGACGIRDQATPSSDPTYAADSPNWEASFAVEHEDQRRRGVRQVQPGGPSLPPPIVSDEDQEAEAAYQVALAGVLHDSEEEARRKAEEEEAYQQQLTEAMALSAAGDCVWTGVVQEFVSVPTIWLGVTLQQEQAYLEHWRSVHLRAECAEGLRLTELEKEEEEE